MNNKSLFSGWLLFVIVLVAGMGIAASIVISAAEDSLTNFEVYGKIADFSFDAHSGGTFSTEQMKGKISVVSFIFTNCKVACPVMTPNMTILYDAFREAEEVQLLSISVDPEHDSIDVLKKYAEDSGVDNDRWIYVRSEIEDVIDLSEKSFMLAASNLPMGHSTKFILVDENLQIRGYYDGMNSESVTIMKDHVTAMARKLQ